jgi:dienelactone hydrolase
MGLRRTFGWITVAALVAAGTATATSGAVSAAPHSSSPHASASAGTADLGDWRVRALGQGRYEVAWTSPTRFPLTSDRPTIVGPQRALVGVSTIDGDGRTVHTVVTSATRPTPATLGVLLSGDRLDVAGNDLQRPVAGGAGRALDLPGTVTLPVDPATPGDFDLVTSDYELAPVKLAGMPEPIEMIGHVVEPAADAVTGPRPLVLFLHGRHGVCYDPNNKGAEGNWPCQAPLEDIPSELGYDYIQQVLASQGFTTVSVRVNGINAQDYRFADGGADARAAIVERHLDHWTDIAAAHQVDLSRVVLVGHSRGGEGVDRASIQIPLSAPYRIVGQVLIAPTDFGTQTAPYIPTVTLLPFCDGDVSDLQGQRFTDTARDLTDDDTSLKSSVLVMGANHNFFNTEWTPGIAQAPANDDWYGDTDAECGSDNPGRLTPEEQQSVGTAYVAGAVRLFTEDEQDLLPMFDGTRARVASTGDAQVLSHAIGGGRDLRKPGVTTGLSLPDGAETRFCRGSVSFEKISSCAREIGYEPVKPHWPEQYEGVPIRQFFEMSWSAAGQSGGMVLDDPLDLSTGRLELRTIVDSERQDADLKVRITDADGASALLTPAGDGVVPSLGHGTDVKKLWAQTVVVDASGAGGVDLTRITQVDLVAQNSRGRVWVADLGAAPATLPSVPDLRLATIDIARLRVDEGDGRETTTAELPFQIVGDLTRPARFSVMTMGQQPGDVERFTVNLAPGQTSGSIPIDYLPDRRDDYPQAITQVIAWATSNVMTDAYAGDLVVLDDDPTPRLTVKPVSRSVAEGSAAEWKVELAKPVDYDLFVNGSVVRSPAPALTAGDVRPAWVVAHAGEVDPGKTLWSLHAFVYDQLNAGERAFVITIPTRKDGEAEGRESIRLKLKINHHTYKKTVFVKPSS